MSVESGWGSSAWGYGKYGQESNEDVSTTINGVATITAAATEASGASSTITAAATITALAGEVHFGQAQIDGQGTVAASARYLWEPKTRASTIWTKQVA